MPKSFFKVDLNHLISEREPIIWVPWKSSCPESYRTDASMYRKRWESIHSMFLDAGYQLIRHQDQIEDVYVLVNPDTSFRTLPDGREVLSLPVRVSDSTYNSFVSANGSISLLSWDLPDSTEDYIDEDRLKQVQVI